MDKPTKEKPDENLEDWAHNPAFQQSPVDHFSTERIPACSRKRAMLLGLFLGAWGIQRFYLRMPALGWLAIVVCKLGIVLGLLMMFVMQQWGIGLVFLVLGPLLAEAIGVFDAVSLATGSMKVDGRGKPLDP